MLEQFRWEKVSIHLADLRKKENLSITAGKADALLYNTTA